MGDIENQIIHFLLESNPKNKSEINFDDKNAQAKLTNFYKEYQTQLTQLLN